MDRNRCCDELRTKITPRAKVTHCNVYQWS